MIEMPQKKGASNRNETNEAKKKRTTPEVAKTQKEIILFTEAEKPAENSCTAFN